MRPNWITCLITAGLLLAIATFANAQDVQHGRISYVDNDGLIRGNADAEWSVAQQNSLVMPGDTIWADENGVLEVEVSGGTFLRLADGSKMNVEAMPPYTHIKAWSGSFYAQRLRHSEGSLVIETPVGEILIEGDSQVRVDVLEEGSTTVSTRWGTAIINSSDGLTVRVGSGQQVFIDPGYAPSSPVNFNREVEDAFDTWNRERSRRIAKGSSATKIGQSGTYAAPIGAYDLEDYGEWVYVDNRSYWKPTVIVDYTPYRTGSWSYVPSQGHVWVGQYPFTYVTSHHGHWSHHNHHGWIWSYNQVYSPAYVASVYYEDNFIWAPLSVHGDAVYVSGSYFTAGGFHFSMGYTSYAHSSYILGGYHHSIYPMSHHTTIINNHYYDAHHWNPCDSDSRYYSNRPHRIEHAGERNYRPQRVMRGPSEVHTAGGDTYSARTRVARLEANAPRQEFAKVDLKPNRDRTRTSTTARQRTATTRDIRFNEAPIQKIAQRDERVRTARNEAPASVLTNRPARGTEGNTNPNTSSSSNLRQTKPARGGSLTSPTAPKQPARATQPSATTQSNQPSRSTARGGSETSSPQVIAPKPVQTRPTPRQTTQPNATTVRPTAPSRSTTVRPEASVPRQSAPSRPQASTPRQSAPSRPQASAPRQSTPSRPQATAPRQSAPSRPQATAPRQSAPSRPQASAPRQSAPSYSPQPSAPRQSTPSYSPQPSAPRQSAPSRPQASAPRQSAPSYSPQPSTPQQSTPSRSQASAPRQSAPSGSSSGSSSSSSSSGGSRRSR